MAGALHRKHYSAAHWPREAMGRAYDVLVAQVDEVWRGWMGDVLGRQGVLPG
jgi:hypothetical protein